MRSALLACVLVGCGRVDFDALTDGGGIDGPVAPLTVTRLDLVDHITDNVIQDVTNGAPVDVTGYPEGVTLIATVAGSPGSVELVRAGMRNVENEAPFASGGDFSNSDVKQDDVLVIGTTPIAVTAYELDNAAGMKGPTRMFQVELTVPIQGIPAIARIGIIDDGNNTFVPITDGAVISISGSNLSTESDLRIDTTPPFVGSVTIGGVGPWASRVGADNWPLYTAMGLGNEFTPTPGTYTITARAFTFGNGQGQGSATTSMTFQLVP